MGFGSTKFIKHNNIDCIKKTYSQSRKEWFFNELKSYMIFSKYSWYPKVYDVGDNYLVFENCGKNLLNVYKELSDVDLKFIKEGIWTSLWDVYSNSCAHRDIREKNYIYSLKRKKLYLIDFEHMIEYRKEVHFLSSYDVIGEDSGLFPPVVRNKKIITSLKDRIFFTKKLNIFSKDLLEKYEKI